MKSIPVLNIKGKSAGKITLDSSYFSGKVNKKLLYQAVLMYLANQRRGSASTKTRAEVRGGGRKPWRQKGTGRARVGSIRNPVWTGGGIAFGPKPKSYKYDFAKKIKVRALQDSLNAKIKNNALIVIDKITLGPKTKEAASFLKAIKAGNKTLVVINKYSPEILRSCRNISGVTVKPFSDINAHDVLKHEKIVISKEALEVLPKRFLQ